MMQQERRPPDVPKETQGIGNHGEPSTIIRGLKPGALVYTPLVRLSFPRLPAETHQGVP